MSDPLRDETSPSIDWTSAEVDDGDLSVAVTGEVPKGWGTRVGEVFARLAATGAPQRWGKVKVSRGAIVVRDVAAGAESDLRHELEAAVLQANADLDAGADQGARTAESSEPDGDERMTDVFRGFVRGS